MGRSPGRSASASPAPPSPGGHTPSRVRRVDVVAGLAVVAELTLFSHPAMTPRPIATVAFAAAGFGLLLLRNAAPRTALLALCAHAVVTSLVLPYRPMTFVCVALAWVAMREPPRRLVSSALPLTFVLAAWVANEVWNHPDVPIGGLVVGYLLCLSAAVGFGLWRRASLELVQQRERVARAEQEHRRDAEIASAVAAERARIARELHDIVAHSVTVMVMQAGGAERIVDADPPRARKALTQIRECGAQAMGELGRMLRLLRADGEAGTDGAYPPGLDHVDALVDRLRRAGVPVRLDVHGVPRPLDSSVDLTAYRIVQEGLTNVTKHAPPGTPAAVTIRWSDELSIGVDNGPGGPAPENGLSTGHGLLGLRERVAVANGSLDAAPTAGGGFRLAATLPLAQTGGGPA